jgi:hypothetical protein
MLSGSSVSSTVYAAFTKPAARSVRRRPRCGRRDAAGWPIPAPAGAPVRRSATDQRVGHLPGIDQAAQQASRPGSRQGLRIGARRHDDQRLPGATKAPRAALA